MHRLRKKAFTRRPFLQGRVFGKLTPIYETGLRKPPGMPPHIVVHVPLHMLAHAPVKTLATQLWKKPTRPPRMPAHIATDPKTRKNDYVRARPSSMQHAREKRARKKNR